jgi:uncharacterized tellurite resistance protein B-like protein
MLQILKELFAQLAGPSEETTTQQTAHRLQLATAVLLVEVLRAESSLDPAERETILNALQARFSLSPQELADLMALAQDTAQTAYDYQQFTSLLNDHFSQAQKIEVIESMWAVAYADAHLDANENHVISKVAGLLHVTHGEYIAAKMRAQEVAPALVTRNKHPATERTPDSATLL